MLAETNPFRGGGGKRGAEITFRHSLPNRKHNAL